MITKYGAPYYTVFSILMSLLIISRYSPPAHFVPVILSGRQQDQEGVSSCQASFPRAVFSSAAVGTDARDVLVQMDVLPRACAAISAALLSRSRLDDSHSSSAGSGYCYVRGIVNSCAVSTSGSITRCPEREVAVFCHLVMNL
jgi:hypothetical protein